MRELTLESVALKAPRPRYCALSNARLAAMDIEMPPWEDALARFLNSG
jgi:dTDP-4-dehydrorhamnose reductase